MEKFFALPQEKQQKILEAALQCFGRHGYAKTSMNDIAQAAQISKASLFQYFGTKKDLYAYLIHYCSVTLQDGYDHKGLDNIPDLFDRIQAAGDMKIQQLGKHPHIIGFLMTIFAETNPEVADLLAPMIPAAESYTRDLALRPHDAIKFKDGVDVVLVMRMLFLMAEGYSARPVAGETLDFDAIMAEFEEILALMKGHFYKEEYL